MSGSSYVWQQDPEFDTAVIQESVRQYQKMSRAARALHWVLSYVPGAAYGEILTAVATASIQTTRTLERETADAENPADK